MLQRFSDDALSKGIRLICYDRPGYGGSTPMPGRRMVDCASDVKEIADALDIERFGVWGISGGGAPALACAAALPDRVTAVASLAGFAPFRAEGLDWFAGMGEMNAADLQLLLRDPAEWDRKSREDEQALLSATPGQIRVMWDSLLSDVDREAFTDEVVEYLITLIRGGLRNGGEGLREDTKALVEPWGFDPGNIHVPVQLWHGEEDHFVPFSHGRWLASRIPGVEAHLLPGEGHITILVRHVPDAQTWLSSKR